MSQYCNLGSVKFTIGCYLLQMFHQNVLRFLNVIFICGIIGVACKKPGMAGGTFVLSYSFKIQFYCLILRYRAKTASWFGTVDRNMARKSPKFQIF